MSDRLLSALRKTLAAVLLCVPFIPVSAVAGRAPDLKGLFTPYQWLLGLFIVLFAGWLAARIIPGAFFARLENEFKRLASAPGIRPVFCSCIFLAALLALVSALAFSFKPLLIDDLVQLFQARIFAAGLLKAPAPLAPEFFITQHMILDESGWYSQYPPGHSAMLMLGVLAGAVWLMPLLLSLGSALILYLFTREIYDRPTALWTLLLAGVCPFFFFMGASFMNHVSALFFALVFVYACVRWEKKSAAGWSFLSGAALGALALSRPLCALAVGLPFALSAFPLALKERRWRSVVCGLGGVLLLSAILPLYNLALTGDPWLSGYVRLWGASHGLGFHVSPWGEMHTPLGGIVKQFINISILNEYLLEWPVPALVPLALYFLLGLDRQGWDRRLFAAFFFVPLCYLFYWHRDSYLGPRFMYCSLIYLLPLTVRAVREIYSRSDFHLFRVSMRHWMLSALALAFGYSFGFGIPQRFMIYASGLQSMKLDLAHELRAEQGIEKALVFVPVSWGNRIINLLRARGATSAVVEQAYRTIDHCLLDELAKRAWKDNLPARELQDEISTLAQQKMKLLRFKINDDPTLRLRPDVPLSADCQDELAYDRQGYFVSAPHILSNSPRLDGKLVFATDLRARNEILRRQYPDYPALTVVRGDYLAGARDGSRLSTTSR